MEATRGTVVTLNYTLRDDEGQILDNPDKPFDYLHGYGQVIPGLEKALEGAEPGHQQEVVVDPAEAYGEPDPGAIFTVPSDNVPEDVDLEPGMTVIGETPTGSVRLTVREVSEENIVVDANHPLAGKRLHFDVEVLDVRAASDQELAQGSAPQS
jgi:FKBP-type peptidyl-prolyl cis-trans isomerase SlyD